MPTSVTIGGYISRHARMGRDGGDGAIPATPGSWPLSSDRPVVEASGSTDAAAGLGAMPAKRGTLDGAGRAAPVKPDLDALNRVLNHYAAQNAATDRIISFVRP